MPQKRVFALFGLLVTAGCSKPQAANVDTPPVITLTNAVDSNLTTADLPVTPTPAPHYQDHEGDRYFYVTAVADDDRKKGQAVGNVVQYRYLGERDGKLTVENVTENGSIIGRLECPRICRIIKLTTPSGVSRLPFDANSIAGAALEDAQNGFLKPTKDSSSSSRAKDNSLDENAGAADSNSLE